MSQQAQLIVVFPEGSSRGSIQEFMGRCICWGLDYYFEEGDRLPTAVPLGVEGVRAIIIDAEDVEANRAALATYEQKGARVYVFQRRNDAVVPATPDTWATVVRLHAVCMDGNLTCDNPVQQEKMAARPDAFIFDSLAERMLKTCDLRWYDATRYNWEGLLDAYEVTGQQRYFDLVREQIHRAMGEQENDCGNCDRVSGFIPALRAYEIERDDEILAYVGRKFDEYLAKVQTYRGCFTNFTDNAHTARAEIVFQVCPGLLHYSKVSGEKKYGDIALEQFDRFNELLLDEETGLWHHGVGDGGTTATVWARLMGYVLLAIGMMLEHLDPEDLRYDKVHGVFERMADKVRQLQDESGFWFSEVFTPLSQKESSGTAWAVAALTRAMRLGLLDSSYAACCDAGWNAVKSRVWRGGYPGTSMATTSSPMRWYYVKNPLNTVGWTHFAFRAACERRRYEMSLALR